MLPQGTRARFLCWFTSAAHRAVWTWILSNPTEAYGSGTSWNLTDSVHVPASAHKLYLLIASSVMTVLQYRPQAWCWSVCAVPRDAELRCFLSAQHRGVQDRSVGMLSAGLDGQMHPKVGSREEAAPQTGVSGGGGMWKSKRGRLEQHRGASLLFSLKCCWKEKPQHNNNKNLPPPPPPRFRLCPPALGGLQLRGGLSAKGKAGCFWGVQQEKKMCKKPAIWSDFIILVEECSRSICSYSACMCGAGVGTGIISVLCHPRHFLICKCHYLLKTKSKLSIEVKPSGSSDRKVR